METRVLLVQQGVWGNSAASMPLAIGYLKAYADADDRIRRRMDISIRNYPGDAGLNAMARDLIRDGCPDILCFSVLGWNFRAFGTLAETFKQMNPQGWVVFGGNHVAYQAERVFRMFPQVDVVVNGEGELIFRDLLNGYLDGAQRGELHEIGGISFREADGNLVTTPERERIQDLEILPSPILTGAIPLVDKKGGFRYDYALMETNRGCPYKCAFCYWGGATGQKIRAFSRERLREELEVLGRHGADILMLADSNFGLMRQDEEFLDDMLRVRRKYGFPKRLETSWAKNKSPGFYRIMEKMKQSGMHSAFILALQTMDDSVLDLMRRRNMKLNDWESLVAWLTDHGITPYLELIWGAPGETVESFLDGYDRAAQHTPFIAVHPLMLLPNTEYHDKREQHGLVTVRGEQDDFDYVLSHRTMTLADNERMLRFICWNRVLARSLFLHNIWVALRSLAGVPQSQVLLSFSDWVDKSEDPDARELCAVARPANSASELVDPNVWRLLTKRLLRQWWEEAMRPALPEHLLPVLDEVFRYDLLCQPVRRLPDGSGPEEDLPVVSKYGESWYLRSEAEFTHPVPRLIAALRRGETVSTEPERHTADFYYRTEFGGDLQHYFRMDRFRGLTEQQLDEQFTKV
ncbi:KedN5 family methylcobalamin-dependent radical SAM C-methyltransferase [Streptomyces acidiscabies]|uniref:KedN5 family methylcobalamin-dependent radical SAM C-methyltransferase n=1 Tax=Streptomyces acidiscabies TaxID=42234 RepID=A0AAP6BEM7_9ACTN|nr:KedN5 family methylcobalamin-dependent radical SAM C-methyltransferase [Streptomyces acidiscabies]MBP5942032.1 KedN5 family methylcobalamin-dependent radical SAM C-methyltransferase [Streptomyces sp. LBUM 1476]MBZ3913508.1 KedN5 family methylcobalamin-dependent radical SAM C-methyltransferase [Streptomyces acidiscabies]MDX2963345.1 KedN5 family methylcobalamin-dependent radical SAM C-methyltransferase [Streptomyces acidiscabies]MDX3023079.1 KedN5 family methylcobalamin-dependent radical SAM 